MKKRILAVLVLITVIFSICTIVSAETEVAVPTATVAPTVAAVPGTPRPVPEATQQPINYPAEGEAYSCGDRIYFGNYWQNDTNGDGKADKNDAKEPIVWRVLYQNEDDLFLISERALDYQPYNVVDTAVTWKTCSLRNWLNGTFYDDAFNNQEKNAIKTTELQNFDNESYNTEGGSDTNDKIFLLDVSEATSTSYGFYYDCSNMYYDGRYVVGYYYYSTNSNCLDYMQFKIPTEYASSKRNQNTYTGHYGSWWLRGSGSNNKRAIDISYNLDIYYYYNDIYLDGESVRASKGVVPVLHLDLNSVGEISIPTATPEATASVTPEVTADATMSVFVSGDYEYKIRRNQTVEITKYLGTDNIVNVPSTINGMSVTRIGERAFANNNTLQSVVMPDSLVKIGKHAFDSCDLLNNVAFKNLLKNIDDYAFYNCKALWLVVVPESVTYIGEYAFGYDANGALLSGFSMTGYAGSVAETYAKDNEIAFLNLPADDVVIPVIKSVKFTKKSVKIKKGKKATLKVKITGAKKATFSVDKKGKKVVKLTKKKAKSVVVVGKKKGKATITAKTAGKKAKCKVTVK